MYLLGVKKIRVLVMLSAMIFLVIGAGCSTKSAMDAGMQEQNSSTASVQGTPIRINDDYIIIKRPGEKSLRLETSKNMTLKGFRSFRAVKLLQPVKIDYREEGGRNIIVCIAKTS